MEKLKQRKTDERYMKEAIKVAVESARRGDYPCGAVLVSPEFGVIRGLNRVRSNEEPMAHAETNAIRIACRAYKNRHLPPGCTLYSTTAPCIFCLSACVWAKVSRVVYACSQSDMKKRAGKHRLRALRVEPELFYSRYLKIAHPTMKIVGGVMRKECLRLFELDSNLDVKWCPKCAIVKPLSEYNKNPNLSKGVHTYCKLCHRLLRREFYKHHRVSQLLKAAKYRKDNWESIRAQTKRQWRKMKEDVINYYGGVCVCCGETELDFLTIDHINGGGNKHRRELRIGGGYKFYRWLIKNNFPPGFQSLCMNCQLSKSISGVCAHQKHLDE